MSYIGSAEGFSPSGDAMVSFPSGATAGDLVVVIVSNGPGRSYLSPVDVPGWQRLGVWRSIEAVMPTSGGSDLAVYWRILPGTAPADFGAWAGVRSQWVALAFRGMRAVTAPQVSRMNNQAYTYPGISFDTARSGHEVLLAIGALLGKAGAVGATSAAGSLWLSWTERYSGAADDPTDIAYTVFTNRTSLPALTVGAYSDRGSGYAISFALVDTRPPAAPRITTPTTGSADLAAGFTFAWQPDGKQSGYRVSRTVNQGAAQYWDGSQWASTVTTLSGATTSITFPPGAFPNASTYSFTVATTGDADHPDLSAATSVTVTAKAPPVAPTSVNVNPATGSAATGSAATSFQSTLSGVGGSAGTGATFTGYEYQIVQGDVTITSPVLNWWWSPGIKDASRLKNGPATFRARSIQDGSQPSAWTSSSVASFNVQTPPTPTLSTLIGTHPTSFFPGIRVTATSTRDALLTLIRGGKPVVVDEPVKAGVDYVVWDFDTSGGLVDYQARIATGDGVRTLRLESDTARALQQMSTSVLTGWLLNPSDPAGAVKVHMQEEADRVHATRTATFQPLTSDGYLVRSLGRVTPKWALSIAAPDPTTVDKALRVLTSGHLCRIYLPNETDGQQRHPAPKRVFRVTSDVTESRIVQGPISWRQIKCDVVEASS